MINGKRGFPVKFFISCLLISLFFVLSCESPPSDYLNDFEWTDVVYSDNGKGITIYLEGGEYVPKSQARALSLQLAQFGFDFLEVVFVYKQSAANGGDIIARATWSPGEVTGISGIHRTPVPGIKYSLPTGGMTDNNGYAMLLVGRKSDKTLLAVGELSHVDGAKQQEVYSGAKSVTFTLDALKTSVSETKSSSSFLTAAGAGSGANLTANINTTNTIIVPLQVADRIFPLYKLTETPYAPTPGKTVRASYNLDTNSSAAGIDFDYYKYGIFRSGEGSTKRIEPCYTTLSGTQVGTTLLHDKFTSITFANNNAAIAAPNYPTIANPLLFDFDISNTVDGSVFSFAFSIPVFALTQGKDAKNGDAVTWYIRPGYETNFYDLDDGKGGVGGAVLVGTGQVEQYVDYRLVTVSRPAVVITHGQTLSVTSGYTFHLLTAEGAYKQTVPPGQITVIANDGTTNKNVIPNEVRGPYVIEVQYADTAISYRTFSDYFTVFVN